MMDICKKEKLFQTYFQEQLEDDEFREAWEKLQPFRAVAQAMIDSGLTEEELANGTGLAPATIRKLENGTINPSVRILQKLAAGIGRTLRISFITKEEAEVNTITEIEAEEDRLIKRSVLEAIAKAKACGKPVARYDTEKKKAFLEYEDGNREYID